MFWEVFMTLLRAVLPAVEQLTYDTVMRYVSTLSIEQRWHKQLHEQAGFFYVLRKQSHCCAFFSSAVVLVVHMRSSVLWIPRDVNCKPFLCRLHWCSEEQVSVRLSWSLLFSPPSVPGGFFEYHIPSLPVWSLSAVWCVWVKLTWQLDWKQQFKFNPLFAQLLSISIHSD